MQPRATVPCIPPPPTFTAPQDLSNVCAQRYCLPPRSTSFKWSPTPEITRSEIESSLGIVWATASVRDNRQGNVLAYGDAALACEGSAWMYEATGDVRYPDLMVRFADNVLALRNSNTTGQVMWNGKKELVWPTTAADAPMQYAGTEQGAMVAHMANAAIQILRTPCLHQLVPAAAASDFLTTFEPGTTYLARAMSYVQAGDETYDTYLLRLFLDPKNLLVQPSDPRWNPNNIAPAADKAGDPVAWNRRMMVLTGMIHLAHAHELLPSPETARINRYDSIIAANIKDFVGSLKKSTSGGVASFGSSWVYMIGTQNTEEAAKGIHGLVNPISERTGTDGECRRYDIFGLFLAWRRNAALYGISNDVMNTFTSQFQNIIRVDPTTFSGLVTGQSPSGAPSTSSLPGLWSLYGKFDRNWYNSMVHASTADPSMGIDDLPLLWMKHAIAVDSDNVWHGKFDTGSTQPSPSSSPQLPPSPPSISSSISSALQTPGQVPPSFSRPNQTPPIQSIKYPATPSHSTTLATPVPKDNPIQVLPTSYSPIDTPTTLPLTSTPPNDNLKLGLGIGLGSLVLLIIGAASIWWWERRHARAHKYEEAESDSGDESDGSSDSE